VAGRPGELRVALTLPAGFRGTLRSPAGRAAAGHRGGPPGGRWRRSGAGPRPRANASLASRRRAAPASPPTESAQRRFAELALPRRRAEALLRPRPAPAQLPARRTERPSRRSPRLSPCSLATPPSSWTGSDCTSESCAMPSATSTVPIAYDRRALGAEPADWRSRRRGPGRRQPGPSRSTCADATTRRRCTFDQALALWQPGDDPVKWASTLLNRGHLHRDLGESDQARRAVQRGARALPPGEGTAANEAGRPFTLWGLPRPGT